jgi:membrane-associated phospholipid phosphatase
MTNDPCLRSPDHELIDRWKRMARIVSESKKRSVHQVIIRDRSIPVSCVVGFALILTATLLLSLLAAGDNVLAVDLSVTRYVQDHHFPASQTIVDFGNAIGTAIVGIPLGLAIAGIFFWRNRPRAAYLILAATALRLVNGLIKEIVDSPRPPANLVHVTEPVSSLGFPSGHVMSVTLLCAAVLVAIWSSASRNLRIAGSVIACLIVLATAYARVSVGAHWPSDAAGGVLWALVLLAVPAAIYARALSRRDGISQAG